MINAARLSQFEITATQFVVSKKLSSTPDTDKLVSVAENCASAFIILICSLAAGLMLAGLVQPEFAHSYLAPGMVAGTILQLGFAAGILKAGMANNWNRLLILMSLSSFLLSAMAGTLLV